MKNKVGDREKTVGKHKKVCHVRCINLDVKLALYERKLETVGILK